MDGWTREDNERFWSKVDKTQSECWLWTGHLSRGYGRFLHKGKKLKPHRIAYELLVGPIPNGYEIDHLCKVKRCVNPAHLELVPHHINIARHFNNRGRCGHELTKDNVYINQRTGGRQCKQCVVARSREQAAHDK